MLDGIPLAALSAPTILGLAIVMLFTGKLWTNPAYQEKAKEAERWRLAYEAEREARKTSDEQTTELLEVTKATHAFITAVFHTGQQIRQSGEPDATTKT